jgi:predicted DCC family thiol-disulfide oxidoreductase YuxK
VKGSGDAPLLFWGGGNGLTLGTAWRARWREVFTLDLRALALFRFALGGIVALDALCRLADAQAFYADAGLWPRAAAVAFDGPLRLSLHLAGGSAGFAVLLLLAQFAAALALALGYRTRLAAIAAFVLAASLLTRNPLVAVDGDALLVCLLFWGLFLPLGARWSLDAALAQNPPPEDPRHCSAAGVGLLLQVLGAHFFAALAHGAEWWPDGTAVYYAMMLDRYATPPGRLLLEFPALMQGLTGSAYFLALLGPLLALSPVLQRPLRFLVLLGLASLHAFVIVTMQAGLTPFVGLAALAVLLAGWAWDRADARLDRGHAIRIFYDKDCAFCLKSCHLLRTFLVLRRCDLLPAQDSVRASALMQAQNSWVVIDAYDVAHTRWSAFVALLRHSLLFRWLAPLAGWKLLERPGNAVYDWVARHRGALGRFTAAALPMRAVQYEAPRAAQFVAAAFVVLVLAWNAVTVPQPPPAAARFLAPLVLPLRLDQGTFASAARPLHDDGWYVIPGALADGTELDLRTGRPVDWRKPGNVAAVEPNARWRAFHTRYWHESLADDRKHYGEWLCRKWNADAADGERLNALKVIYMLELTPPPGGAPGIEQRVLWRQSCPA